MSRQTYGALLVGFFISLGAYAGPAELLDFGRRPTVTDMKKHLDPWPEQNPFPTQPFSNLNVSGGLESDRSLIEKIKLDRKGIAEALPRIIAGLERAYPGATFAPLGRDAVALGDMLDAFYQSIGQSGRVSRLNASGGTFSYASHDNIALFLESAGLVMGPQNKDQPPFIVLDNTHYGQSSQSTQVIGAGYTEHVRRGGDLVSFIRKFNLVSFSTGSELSDPYFDVDQFLKNEEAKVSNHKTPTVPLKIDLTNQHHVALAYTYEYHGPFGQFARQEDGSYHGTIGGLSYLPFREAALAHLFEIIDLTRAPEFLAQVQAEAKKLGYEFPLERRFDPPRKIRIPRWSKATFNQIKNHLDQFLASLPPVGEQRKGRLSANANHLNQVAWQQISFSQQPRTQVPPIAVALYSFEVAAKGFEQGRIGKRDFRRLVSIFLGYAVNINEEKFFAAFRALLKKQPSLLKILKSEKEFFTDSKRNTVQNGVNLYAKLEEKTLKTFADPECPKALGDTNDGDEHANQENDNG